MKDLLAWFEIPVLDLARACAFYERLLGQPLRPESYGAPGQRMAVLVSREGQALGALIAGNAALQPGLQGSVLYLSVAAPLAHALAQALDQGAQVLTPATALPEGLGCFAHIRDSEGNRIGIHAMH